MAKKLMKGNEAVVFGSLLGGATHFFGYPITPASEVAHTAALQFTRSGRTFLQAESEVASINMVYGASAAGSRVMTASSGPGIALMAEGISYLAGAELPALIVDIQRAGPGLGNIWPEQGDYNMVVKGGGHGNYRNIVFAPNSCQEMADFAYRAFEIADHYRMTVFILSDAYIGQMMEQVDFPREVKTDTRKDWAVYADQDSRKNCITSIYMNAQIQSQHNINLQEKYSILEQELTEWEELYTEDAEVLVVAYGITSRIVRTAVEALREEGIAAGLFRPKTLYPFPVIPLRKVAARVKKVVCCELSNGQLADDLDGMLKNHTVIRYNWYGGIVPQTQEIIDRLKGDL
ncbi:MAG: 3-methyl-2-oxobutanoate dehydrogenase subunit VorB [Spirochaetia bacterium]